MVSTEMPANVKAMIGIMTTYIAAFIDDTVTTSSDTKDNWNAIWTNSTWADAEGHSAGQKPSRRQGSEHRRHP